MTNLVARQACPTCDWTLQEFLVGKEGANGQTTILLECRHAGCGYKAILHFQPPLPETRDGMAGVRELLERAGLG